MFTTFIKATNEYCTLEKNVPAPYFRHNFELKSELACATLYITGLGFYEAHINGKDITKGILAPYISNPEHYVYYDKYNITDNLNIGKNTLGVILGNGFQNAFGGYVWDFDKASFRASPMLSYKIEIKYKSGEIQTIEPSESVKTAPSPILSDDLRHGECYDARCEIEDWDKTDFDDTHFSNAIIAEMPKGEQKLCTADAIREISRIKPVSVTACDDGYIYDFGINSAGLCKLCVKDAQRGQKITLKHFETLKDGKPYYKNIRFADERTEHYQENIYICKGSSHEEHIPRFTYDGFRYVFVTGINKEQAKDLLTFIEYSSNPRINGSFSCDNEIINKLQAATVRSDISNLYYFPTDCPQREKNGWTADASLSAEQMLFNIAPENCYSEWILNICKAMTPEGKLPGIIPTGGWGYTWGNGPAWDIVLVNLPYYTYIYRGNTDILKSSAEYINKYLHYLDTRLNDDNLMEIGLGDWCEPDRDEGEFRTPLIVTDSIVSVDIARKAKFIFERLGLDEYKAYAEQFEKKLTKAIKEKLIDKENATVYGNTETAQAMGLYYGMFDKEQYEKAFANLLEMLKETENHCYCGVVGGSIFYKLLAENGYTDLALDIMTNPEFPSYGNWIVRGATTLWETFRRENDTVNSLNHHFWGFISAWFYNYIAGIKVNPEKNDPDKVEISPAFPKKISNCKAQYGTPNGKISVNWKRCENGILLTVEKYGNAEYDIALENFEKISETEYLVKE